jgi:competence protein ComEC
MLGFCLAFIGLGGLLSLEAEKTKQTLPDLYPYMCAERHLKVVADSKVSITPYNKQLDVRAVAVWADSIWQPVQGRIRLRIPLQDSTSFQQWDALEVYAYIRDYHVKNEGYQRYLHQSALFHVGYVKRIIPGPKHRSATAFASSIQQALSSKIAEHIAEAGSKAIAKAMLLGDKTSLPRPLKQAFATTGLSHVLAISGLHVGLIFLLLNLLVKPLRRFRYGRQFGQALVLIILLGYMLVTGAAPAVCRAVLMFGLMTLVSMCGKRVHVLNILGASAMVQLCLDPSLLFQLGFQLSYLAVAGIVLLLPFFERISFTGNRLFDGLYAWISVSISGTIFTAPLTISTFGVFPTHFILANILVSLVVSGAVLTGFLLVLLHWLPGVNAALGWLCNQTMALLQTITEWVASLPGAQLRTFSLHDEGMQWLLLELGITAMLLLLPRFLKAMYNTPFVQKRHASGAAL